MTKPNVYSYNVLEVSLMIKEDNIRIDDFVFDLIWPSVKKIDETTDWILMVDIDSKELYEGQLDHNTGFLKKYTYIEGQPKKSR